MVSAFHRYGVLLFVLTLAACNGQAPHREDPVDPLFRFIDAFEDGGRTLYLSLVRRDKMCITHSTGDGCPEDRGKQASRSEGPLEDGLTTDLPPGPVGCERERFIEPLTAEQWDMLEPLLRDERLAGYAKEFPWSDESVAREFRFYYGGYSFRLDAANLSSEESELVDTIEDIWCEGAPVD